MSVNVLPASIASIYGLQSIEEPAQRDMLTIVTVDDQVVGVIVLLAGRDDVFRGFGKAILVRSVRARLNKSWRPSSKIVDLGLCVAANS